MDLSSCPIEILHMVCSHLDKVSDVNSLCLTNTLFNSLFREGLYRLNTAQQGTALHWAAEHGELRTTLLCLAAGADINLPLLPSNDTPLHIAAKNGQTAIATILLDYGARLSIRNSSGLTPLGVCHLYSAETLRQLILKGGMATWGYERTRMLLRAIRQGASRAMFQFLFDTGAGTGTPAEVLVLEACSSGNIKALKFLYDEGLSITTKPPFSSSLVIAMLRDRPRVIEWLLDHGVEITPHAQSQIRFHMSLSLDRLSASTLMPLIQYGLDINNKCPYRQTTALMDPYNTWEDMEVLLDVGADLDCVDHHGRTALHWMSYMGSIRRVVLLLRHGAQLGRADSNGWTALHCACLVGHLPLVGLLLDHGSSPNLVDKYGLTPLHLACARNKRVVETLLIDCGADQRIKCRMGWTAEQLRDKIKEDEFALTSTWHETDSSVACRYCLYQVGYYQELPHWSTVRSHLLLATFMRARGYIDEQWSRLEI